MHCVHKIINMEFGGKINDTGYKFLSPTSAFSLLSILNPMTLPTRELRDGEGVQSMVMAQLRTKTGHSS